MIAIDEFIVRQKQCQQVRVVIMAVGMTAASLFCAIQRLSLAIRIVGIIGVLFFCLCFLYLLWRLLHPKALLVINREGVKDQSGAVSVGTLLWQDIASFGITTQLGQTFLSIKLKDTDAFFAAIPAWKVLLIKANMTLGYRPVSITLQTADRTIDEVIMAMEYFCNHSVKA